MKRILLLLFIFFCLFPIYSQQSNFNLQAYKDFLAAHQNMSAQDVMQLYSAGVFKAGATTSYNDALYFDTIAAKYSLTDYEKQLIGNNGFMISERLGFESFGAAVKDIFYNDLPVFVSSDAILHTVHRSYDEILMTIEKQVIIEELKNVLNTLHSQMGTLDNLYKLQPLMTASLRDYDIYIAMGKRLIGMPYTLYYPASTARFDSIYNFIMMEQFVENYSLFGEKNHGIDFSQFKPRGHYTEMNGSELPKYFRAMMWFGRVELYLIPPSGDNSSPRISTMRSAITSALVLKAVKSTTAYDQLQEIDRIIKYLVGESDNVTVDNLQDLFQSANITDPAQLTDSLTLFALQDTLISKPFAFQKIMSQVLMGNEMSPDSVVPASAFMLLGQRFIIDSYITGQVVYDRITYNNKKIRRMLPSTLDVLFGLGNDASAQLLQQDLNYYHYGTNLTALRYLVDAYDPSFWSENVFNTWLNSLRALNPPSSRIDLPGFMQTAAWWQEKMNTQLGSWTELRHDNILYSKQSYTGVPVCTFPYSYVEPNPLFYNNLKIFGQKFKEVINTITFYSPAVKAGMIQFCDHLQGVCDTLKSISEKELNNIPISVAESNFLKSMLRYLGTQYTSTPLFDGWYYNLIYNNSYEKFVKKDYLVADIHTSPANEGGAYIGWVKHAGTGKINLGVFVIEYPTNLKVAYVGPFYSYNEYTTTNFLRLTDEEWVSSYLSLSHRPNWVNLYLADTMGNSRGTGPSLITHVTNIVSNTVQPTAFEMLQNYPNPFNSTTLIKFTVPFNTNDNTEIGVYDIQGRLVKKLVNQNLSSGSYIIEWDGTNNSNLLVSSGVYLCRGKSGGNISTIKLILMK